MATLLNTTISDTGNLRLPVGATGDRPSPEAAQLRYNNTINRIEVYNGAMAAWIDQAYTNVQATGGNSVYETDVEGTTYAVHVFRAVGNTNFVVTQGGRVEYLIVAGGGGGAGNFYDDGPGGGAGGLVTGFTDVTPQTYTITVGGGGAGQEGSGGFGGNSVAFGLTALGGGGGASHRSSAPGGGGSGGGGGGSFLNDGLNVAGGPAAQPGSASGGFGNAGGNGGINNTLQGGGYPASGGGGGAGSPGGWPGSGPGGGPGGMGLCFDITGYNTFYAGGGGGLPSGAGGIGGGATAQTGRGGTPALPATPNTGGGGGGGRTSGGEFGSSAGGAGIVVIRYPVRQKGLISYIREVNDTSIVANFDFSHAQCYPGTGSLVYDSRSAGTTGILVNSPTVRDFRTHRSSFEMNGSNQHIRLENFKNRPTGTGLTLEAWIFPRRAVSTGTLRGAIWSSSSSTYLGIFDSNDGGANHGLHWALQTVGQRTGGNNGSIPRNNWSHIVGTYDGSRTRGYVNGVLVYDVAQTGNVTDGTWYLGTYGQGINDGTHNHDGFVTGAKIYNRTLSITEIQNNLNASRWRFGI
jgi:hypothetical protein